MFLDIVNNSKISAGLALLMLNVGAKYVQGDLGRVHDAILSNEYVKKIIVFCLFFVATRDIAVAFLLSVFYIIVIDGILHEKRKFCIVPKKYIEKGQVSSQDYKRAQDIIQKYESEKQPDPPVIDYYNNYIESLKHIKNI